MDAAVDCLMTRRQTGNLKNKNSLVPLGGHVINKKFKWPWITLLILLGVFVLVLAIFYIKGNSMVTRHYTIVPESITIPIDAASLERGKHL